MPPTLNSLEEAAADVIAILKTIPEFADREICIIGGMALWKYLGNSFRTTDDVDFCITLGGAGAPKRVKDELLKDRSTHFEDRGGTFVYKPSTGGSVQIDVCGFEQGPFRPSSMQTISTIEPGKPLPYIEARDLLVFKINSCGMRPKPEKKRRDADDAATLLAFLTSKGALKLSDRQKEVAEQGLPDIIKVLGEDEEEWKEKLGIK